MADEEAVERRVRDELYAKAVDAVALRLRTSEMCRLDGVLTRRSEHLREVAGIMAQLASELLGVPERGVWEDATSKAHEPKG